MLLLEALERRATLRVLWELRGEPLTFRALVEASESNPSVVNSRLRELRELGVVEHRPGGYRLTSRGQELLDVLLPLNAWADQHVGAHRGH